MEIKPLLSLSDAVADGRLDEFIAQEEARGVGPDYGIKGLAVRRIVNPASIGCVIASSAMPRR